MIHSSYRQFFTLMEVMIAALVFTLSAVVTLQIVGTSRANYQRDLRRWQRQNAVTNAAEFFLMCGPDAALPEKLLPEGWGATCELRDIEEELPEDARESISGWRLGEYVIQITDNSGETVEEMAIRKLVQEEDVDYVNSVAK